MDSAIRTKAIWRLLSVAWLFACVLVSSGCVTTPYHYGTGRIDKDAANSPPLQQQMLIGKPNKFLDAADWYWPESLLGKLLLWNKNIDSHQISDRTIDALQSYVAANDLSNVQIHVNAYYPGNQWQRLFNNRTVGAGWRYTLGILSVVNYTILPGRFFGGDAYNPYTNTIYLYSDERAIALHEAGHSKDFGRREYKGTNAFIYQLPLASLYYEGVASSDALSYVNCRDPELQKEAYKLLYPAWSTYAGGNISQFYSSPWWSLSVIPGHIIGRSKAANVQPCELPPVEPASPVNELPNTNRKEISARGPNPPESNPPESNPPESNPPESNPPESNPPEPNPPQPE